MWCTEEQLPSENLEVAEFGKKTLRSCADSNSQNLLGKPQLNNKC